MKLEEKVCRVITNIKDSEKESFKIKASAKAYYVLSNLYSFPKHAVIRELSTNAYDSHIQSGKGDIPFEVHIPTWHEPFFEIKDYGTGLSPESIKNLYITYFDSDKIHTNELNGCLGLGSKSPFTVSSSFLRIDC